MSSATVLHVIPGLGTGGAEQMLATLVTARRDRPIAPVVVDLIGDGDFTAAIRAAGVPVHELGLRHPAAVPLVLARLAGLIRQLRPAAIQSWLYYGDLMAYWALNLSGLRRTTRLYWGLRCSNMDQTQLGPFARWTIAACARRSAAPDAVVANSFAGRDAHRQLSYAPRAFAVIPNGIDTTRFRPDAGARRRIRQELGIGEDRLLAIHVARIDPTKDHGSMLKVAAALPEIQFIAVGSGTERLDAPANLLRLGKRRDVAALYAACDIFLGTSAFGEGFPNVVAEAMASGVPVAATDVGDTARIVADTGFVVPARDVSAMTDALRKLAAEARPDRDKRAARCRARIESTFSLARYIAAFDRLHLTGALPD